MEMKCGRKNEEEEMGMRGSRDKEQELLLRLLQERELVPYQTYQLPVR